MLQKLLLSQLLVVITFLIVAAQPQITEINGRQVEFKDDGTWEYLEEEDYEEQQDEEQNGSVNLFQWSTEKFESRKSSQEQRKEKRPNRSRVNCSNMITVDLMADLSGLQRQSEEVFVIGRNSFFMHWTYSNKNGLLFNIQFKKPRCISNMDKISFYFRDLSENFTVTNIANPNCDGFIKIQDEKVVKKLKTEKIRSISIKTKEGIFTENISDANAQSMIESTNCISKIRETN